MTFNSIVFLVFFAIVFGLLCLTKIRLLKDKFTMRVLNTIRKSILLIASFVFYGWWDWRFCFLMLFLIEYNYFHLLLEAHQFQCQHRGALLSLRAVAAGFLPLNQHA